ncbi:MAG: lytic murein transglycosylase B [Burkholderiales bacterium]|nr:lytic murein transglycosylase B [Burkholderiales bacterium]
MPAMRRRTAAQVVATALVWPVASLADAPPSYDERPEVRAFADEVATRRGWSAGWVLAQLREARLMPAAQRLMMPLPDGRKRNWDAYRERFVEPIRIAAGSAFWRANEAALARAEARFGVPPAIVVGIVGVETFYGRRMGSFRVLDALATLAFDFPAGRSDRSAYFREELEEFLILARRERLAPASVMGSFAGAIGLPQFMPGSINRHAVDFDEDVRIDLMESAADAIGSVARFLAEHGWQRGMPAIYAVQPPADEAARSRLLAPDIVPSFRAAEMLAAGAQLDEAGRRHDGPLALVMVENGDDAPPSHFAGSANFFSLTRYNRSSYYALAVIHLGQAVQARR